jgi:large subunit ribosomal protein L19
MANILTKAGKSKLPQINPGDIVRVHQKIKEGNKERIQVFEGIVIKTHRKIGPNATFTVRKIASGIGVERIFLLQSPNIVKIEFKKSSKVRRAKLYYLRNLSGKALRLKEKKVDKDVWELVAPVKDVKEVTEEELAEAVEASTQKEEVEQSDIGVIESEPREKTKDKNKEVKSIQSDKPATLKDDTVNGEKEDEVGKKDKQA